MLFLWGRLSKITDKIIQDLRGHHDINHTRITSTANVVHDIATNNDLPVNSSGYFMGNMTASWTSCFGRSKPTISEKETT